MSANFSEQYPSRQVLSRLVPMARVVPLLALALMLSLTASLTAQVAPPAGGAPTTQDPQGATPIMTVDEDTDTIAFSMNESNGMELAEFIKWAQEVTGKRFTFSTQELGSGSTQGSAVSFLGTFRIKRDRFQEDFYSFFQTMLYIKGFAIVPRGEGDLELLEIVMMTGQRGREVTNGARYVAPEELERYRYQTGVPILTTVKLHSINAQLANNALRPFFASTGGTNAGGSVQIGSVGNQSSLLLQGFGPQVYAAVELLRLVDMPTEQSGPVFKAVTHNAKQAVVLSGSQEQIREALDLIARLDVPGGVKDAETAPQSGKSVIF